LSSSCLCEWRHRSSYYTRKLYGNLQAVRLLCEPGNVILSWESLAYILFLQTCFTSFASFCSLSAVQQYFACVHHCSRRRRFKTTSAMCQIKDAQLYKRQSALVLHGPNQKYTLVNDLPTPSLLEPAELLVRTETIGLNPIDWKAPSVAMIRSPVTISLTF
jgi:hypothetical protein